MDEVRANVGLAEDAVSGQTADLVIDLLKKLPEHMWDEVRLTVVPPDFTNVVRIKEIKNRVGFGRPQQPPVPPLLKQLGNEAWESAVRSLPDFPDWDLFSPDTVVVNRYDPGKGVGFHKDPPRQNAFIMGITLYEHPIECPTSKMKFKCDASGEVHVVPTPHRSAYLVTGPAYHAAKHSRAASKRQLGRIYSVTFRAKRRA